jgi:hypothetical protein
MTSQNSNSEVLWKCEIYLDGLPWRRFARGGGFWIFADESLELTKRLTALCHDLRVGDFVYRLKRVGEKSFIHRFPPRRRKKVITYDGI